MRSKLSKTTLVLRRVILVVWTLVVLTGVGSYILFPRSFSAENIAAFLERFGSLIWVIYLVFSILRGFTLLPSTPLVIAGTILFPQQPFAVLVTSMTGILLSSTMIYYFSEFLGFDEYFEDHKPELTHKIKAKLEHPLGFVFVAAWAFFPLVPTDLVCYLAGTTRMDFREFIAAVGIGELILCVCYIFLGGTLLGHFL